jgi:3'-phosphoadenosine 5'-phosphosulfate sulfotransferase (PAPS reductase)/FAD synthetase
VNLNRHILWVDGANSAVMAKFVLQEIPTALVAHCDLGDSVHEDSHRFINDLEQWYGTEIVRLRSEKYANIDEVFEARSYLAGINGAPCTFEAKVVPRLNFQLPSDTHYWGYTSDKRDAKRWRIMQTEYPLLKQRSPLVDIGMRKTDTHAYLADHGIRRPYVYEIGMPNGNCLCCVKASSPNYWAHQRKYFPLVFARRAAQCRKYGAKLTRINGVRIYIDEIPLDWPTTIKDNFGGCGFHCATDTPPNPNWYDL